MEPIRPRTSGPHKPIFATFYSFKGGVGRTMALLNAAAILAGRGRRVLMIDFDLEAPGLTLFQDRQLGEKASRKQEGLVDALREFIDTPRKAALAEENTTRFFETYVTSLPIPESVQKLEDGQLDLIPVGRLDDEYESRLYNLDFEELFERGVGKPLFDRFKAVIRDSRRYDYVLIDSRTGFSDEGSICTQYLGDYLVVLTGLNRQNVRGTARFLTRARVAERKQRLMLVASPVPMYYEQLRAERLGVAKQMLADAGLGDIRFTAQIPYHPMLALDEDPSVYSLAETDLFEAYEQIVETLLAWANDRPEERIQEALEILNSGNAAKAAELLRYVGEEEPQQVVQVLTNLAGFIEDRMPSQAPAILEEGLIIARKLGNVQSESQLLTHIGNAWLSTGESRRSIPFYEQALQRSLQLIDQQAEEVNLGNLGNAYQSLGEVSQAIEYHEQGLAISREIGARRGESSHLSNLGNAYQSLGEVSQAIEYHEQGLAISREIGDRRGESSHLSNLGVVYFELGEESKALEYYEQALEISRDINYMHPVRKILGNLGEVYEGLGEMSKALEYYEQALEISREIGDRGDEGYYISNMGRAYAYLGQRSHVISMYHQVQDVADKIDSPSEKASICINIADAFSHIQPEQARQELIGSWEFIIEHANAFERAKAHVLRARLLTEQEEYAEAAESAQTALTFYQERGVDSVWSREAEEWLSKAQAHQG